MKAVLGWTGRAAPWALVAVALALGLLAVDTPVGDIARFAAYWLLCLMLPGTLVYRAVRGSRGNLPEDLGYGAATGLIVEVGAWALATATDLTAWLRFWPAPIVIAFIAIPALRRHWRVGEPKPLPAGWSWCIATVMITTVAWATDQWRALPLPPVAASYYPDMPYHLSIVRELMRPMPFQLPQMAGEPLSYHYLSHAHMAAGSLISGVDPVTVVFRLWLAPIVLIGVLVVAAAARELSDRVWAGPIAAALTFAGAPIFFGGPTEPLLTFPVAMLSPSMTYAMPILILVAVVCAAGVRGRRLGAAWALVPVGALVSTGAKASGPPLLVAGALLALLAGSIVNRRFAWPAAAVLAGLLVGFGAGLQIFFRGGSGAGFGVQVLSTLQWLEPYRETVGAAVTVTTPGVLPPGLVDAGGGTWRFSLSLVGWYVIAQLQLLIGLGVVFSRATRRDPAAWLLGGATLAGVGGLWFLFHAAASQLYFLRAALPLAVVAAAWLLAAIVPERRALPMVAGAFAGGGVLLWVLKATADKTKPVATTGAWLGAIYGPVLRAAIVAAVLIAAWWVARIFVRSMRGRGAAVAVAAVLGVSLAGGVTGVWSTAEAAVGGAKRTTGSAPPPSLVTAAEMRAALWLDRHAGPEDVIATNVHCINLRTRPTCDSRSYWVTGLTGRVAVIESWGYMPQSVGAHGVNGLGFSRQPPPDQARFDLNERVFTDPRPEDLRLLHDRLGVRWLFADSRAGPVSLALTTLTHERYVDGPVKIYQLTG